MFRQLKNIFPGIFHWCNLPAFSALIALTAGIVSVTYVLPVGRLHSSHLLYLIVRITAIICLVSGVFSKNNHFRLIFFFFAGAFFWGARACKDTLNFQELTYASQQGDITVTGVIATAPTPKYGNVVFLLKVTAFSDDADGSFNGMLFRAVYKSQIAPVGETIKVKGTLKPPAIPLNRFDFDERALFQTNGIAATIEVKELLFHIPPAGFFNKVIRHLRLKIFRTLKLYRKTFHRSLVRAAFLGERGFLSSRIMLLFTLSGLAHLLALSGLHAGIILSAVYALFFFIPVQKKVKHVTAILMLWSYLLFVGPVPSLARATIMATVVIVTLLFQRKPYPLQSLGIAGIVWLVLTPASLFQAGFQLSFLATAGILVFWPRLKKWCPEPENPVAAYMSRLITYPFFISLSVFAATAPVLLYHFGAVSLYSLFANIIAVPLMTIGMWLFFGALLLPDIFLIVNQMITGLSGICFDGLLLIAKGIELVPWMSVELPVLFPEACITWYGVLIAMVTVSKNNLVKVFVGGFLVLFCLLPGGYFVRRMTGHMQCISFATGGGVEALVLKWPDGRAWLFCTGSPIKIRRVIDRTVDTWVHHTPDTKLEHIFTLDGNHMISDSNTISGINKNYTGDTLVVNSNKVVHETVSCRFFHENGGAVLHISDQEKEMTINIGTDRVVVKRNNQEEIKKIAPPFIVTLIKKEVTVKPYR